MIDGDCGVFPLCRAQDCTGELVPLSDYGPDGACVPFKAWVCTVCTRTIRIDKGVVGTGHRRVDVAPRRRVA